MIRCYMFYICSFSSCLFFEQIDAYLSIGVFVRIFFYKFVNCKVSITID